MTSVVGHHEERAIGQSSGAFGFCLVWALGILH